MYILLPAQGNVFPTGPFPISEAQDQEIGEFYEVRDPFEPKAAD